MFIQNFSKLFNKLSMILFHIPHSSSSFFIFFLHLPNGQHCPPIITFFILLLHLWATPRWTTIAHPSQNCFYCLLLFIVIVYYYYYYCLLFAFTNPMEGDIVLFGEHSTIVPPTHLPSLGSLQACLHCTHVEHMSQSLVPELPELLQHQELTTRRPSNWNCRSHRVNFYNL